MTHQQKLKQAESLGTLHVLWGLYSAADTSFGVTMERVVTAQPGLGGSGTPDLRLQVSFIQISVSGLSKTQTLRRQQVSVTISERGKRPCQLVSSLLKW